MSSGGWVPGCCNHLQVVFAIPERLTGFMLRCRPGARQLHFDFLRQPLEIVTGDDGSAQAIRLEKTQLQETEDGRVSARGTGQFETIPADLVLISIGYRSVPIAGAGFDPDRGIILNR